MSSIPLFSSAEGSPIVPTYPAAQPKPPAAQRIGVERMGVEQIFALPKLGQVTPASRLEMRPTPETVASGVRELDALLGGWPRGCLTEICGSASSGRASVLLAALAAATQRQEACALVDASDMFDPESAAAAGMDFERLLWVRCDAQEKYAPRRHRGTEKIRTNRMEPAVEQAMRVTDLLLQSGGFGMIAIDLGGVPFRTARRIPLASWFRYQRAVEHTSTALLVMTLAPCAQSCATVLLKLSAFSYQLSAKARDRGENVPAHAQLFEGIPVDAEVVRSRMAKPAQSVRAAFKAKAARIG
jgi:hypothetical protein